MAALRMMRERCRLYRRLACPMALAALWLLAAPAGRSQGAFPLAAKMRQAIQARLGDAVQPAAASSTAPAVASGGVLSAATYTLNAPVAPGMLVAIFGSNFAGAGAFYTAPTLPWPTQLGGASVTIGGEAMPVYAVTPGQINAVIPYDVAVNTSLPLVVTTAGGTSPGEPVSIVPSEPGIFTLTANGLGTGIVVIAHPDGSQMLAGGGNIAKAGDVLVIYGTGLGAKTPAVVAGQAASLSTLAWANDPVSVMIGGVKAPNVAFDGAAPGWSGLDQINVTVPAGVAASLNTPLELAQSGRGSTAAVTVPTGTVNTYFVSGTVAGLVGGASVELLLNGGGALTVSANGWFTFPAPLASGAQYAVTVGAQPAGQSCQVANGGPAAIAGNVTNVVVICTGSPTTERALTQAGLSIAMANSVLQTAMYRVFSLIGGVLGGAGTTGCMARDGFGLVLGSTGPLNGSAAIYFDTGCTKPYIEDSGTFSSPAGAGITIQFDGTDTYFTPGGTQTGTLALNEVASYSDYGNDDNVTTISGVGTFTPNSGAGMPVQLGLACQVATGQLTDTSASMPCSGGVAQDFPRLGLAIGSVTKLTLNVTNTSTSFSGASSVASGPAGSLTLASPSPSSLLVQGGAALGTLSVSGSAAGFSFFPPTPTGWTLTDAAHDMRFQLAVVDNATRNSKLSVTRISTGATLASGTVDMSGTGSITYSDGTTAAITAWTVAD